MFSYLSHLQCNGCKKPFPANLPANLCPYCGKVLYARYDLNGASNALSKNALQGRAPTMWRYHEVLPVKEPDNVVSLGEGFTPLVKAQRLGEALGCASLYVKEEGNNPTGSFKVRGLSAAVSKAKELGIAKLGMPSAGNAAGAMAAYCARAGLQAHVFLPEDTPTANVEECRAYGAELTFVKGSIAEAGKALREHIKGNAMFDVSTLKEPYRVEGKKTLGYEIAEQLGWRLPDVIVYPTGGGTGLIGMWKAFDEMEEMGWIDRRRPRMVSVQAEGCAPIMKAFLEDKAKSDPWPDPRTVAAGLRVPSPIGDYLILQVLRESGGSALTVTDVEMLACVKELSSYEGIFPCPEGAATLAALKRLLKDRAVSASETIVLVNTGSGLKYLDILDLP